MTLPTKQVTLFYGSTCPYCQAIMPAVYRLEKDDGVVFERLEVCNNDKNNARMEALVSLYDTECGGNMVVPSFYDADTRRLLCNPGTYEALKQWLEQS